MNETFSRNTLYWGIENQKKLLDKHVIIVGLGGVGGYCAEMLARAGVGELTLIDFDTVSQSNINRQIVALNSTINDSKTTLFEVRLKDINPDIKLNIINDFYSEKMNDILFNKNPDFVADAIDTIKSKISLLKYCTNNNIPVISSMGAGNRLDPTKLYISDISEIHDKKAPFVSSIIYQLKKRNITKGITVVTSDEKPFVQKKITETEHIITKDEEIEFKKIIPSSTPFVASTSGIYMASYIVKELLKS